MASIVLFVANGLVIDQGLQGRVGVSDVERLEETQEHLVAVKNLVDKYQNCYDKDIALKYCRDLMRYHTRWLIQQAERVGELIKAHELKDIESQGLVRQLKTLQSDFEEIKQVAEMHRSNELRLNQQNKRYREAFKQIKLQILLDGAIEDHRKNTIEIIDEALEGEE